MDRSNIQMSLRNWRTDPKPRGGYEKRQQCELLLTGRRSELLKVPAGRVEARQYGRRAVGPTRSPGRSRPCRRLANTLERNLGFLGAHWINPKARLVLGCGGGWAVWSLGLLQPPCATSLLLVHLCWNTSFNLLKPNLIFWLLAGLHHAFCRRPWCLSSLTATCKKDAFSAGKKWERAKKKAEYEQESLLTARVYNPLHTRCLLGCKSNGRNDWSEKMCW